MIVKRFVTSKHHHEFLRHHHGCSFNAQARLHEVHKVGVPIRTSVAGVYTLFAKSKPSIRQ
ncbi:hypothetical protein LP421_02695 (plasmid) [Rhizobium sp. RCAM05350]|nr:hypothetical protein LP421_02695 [Rhizobium sp. RCAM05350]